MFNQRLWIWVCGLFILFGLVLSMFQNASAQLTHVWSPVCYFYSNDGNVPDNIADYEYPSDHPEVQAINWGEIEYQRVTQDGSPEGPLNLAWLTGKNCQNALFSLDTSGGMIFQNKYCDKSKRIFERNIGNAESILDVYFKSCRVLIPTSFTHPLLTTTP